MGASGKQTVADVLESVYRVPTDVVYRSFAHETVVLNLATGKYHGLNATAGAMLQELERGDTARVAATRLAERFDRPLEEIEDDLSGLCRDLLERGLIETSAPAGGDRDAA
jgi:hypothetical protein